MKQLRIIYMGTPELSAQILEGLIQNGYTVIAVIAQEDKPVGRKNRILPVPTKVVAERYRIPVFQPHRIRQEHAFVRELNPDLLITCAYGQIVPQEVLEIPSLGCINVHGSLLPKYRGASPIQSALMNGETETGVTIMEMIDRMDAGRMILKKSFPIEPEDTYTSLCGKIAACGLEALLEAIPGIVDGSLPWIEQKEEEATYCAKITREDEHLDASLPAKELINRIRALSETPGGYFLMDGQILKIFRAEWVSDEDGVPGTIVRADKKALVLQTGQGRIALTELQKQGKKRMRFGDFINGERDLLHKILR